MRSLRVFLCHASQDKPAVRKLHRYLKQRGVQPWLDELDLLPGENWEVEIPKALFSSDVILVCLSKNSVDKEGYVQKEITFALDKALEKPEGTIFIVPVKLEECEVPRRLNQYQWVDLFRQDGYKRLMLGLQKRANGLGADISPVILEETRKTPKHEKKPEEQIISAPVPAPSEEEAKEESKKEIPAPPQEEKVLEAKFAQQKPFTKLLEPSALSPQKVPPQGNVPPTNVPPVKKPMRWLGIGGIILLALILGGFGLNSLFNNLPIPTPTLRIGSTMTGQHGETLVYVPAGEFTMGSDNGNDNKPAHTVYLDAFWIDRTEVTNKQYKACVDAGTCEPPSSSNSYTHPSYYENPEFDNYPVLYVNWDKANRYCEVWAGGDLPTEAQWEKAARGTDERVYPWGNDAPDNGLLNYNSSVGDTTEVGKYPSGKSPYGAYDMAGNVWEWVNDYYQSDYYAVLGDSASNPVGPESGETRVLRGGSWNNYSNSVRTTYRFRSDSTNAYYNNLGFRCSRLLP